MKFNIILIILLCVLSPQLSAGTTNDVKTLVKKSKNNRCHTQQSPYYRQIKHFIAYKSLVACLESGGQMPGHEGKSAGKLARNIAG